jgi:hypothetical protein
VKVVLLGDLIHAAELVANLHAPARCSALAVLTSPTRSLTGWIDDTISFIVLPASSTRWLPSSTCSTLED